MTRQDYIIIMGYFNAKKMDRKELETALDFDNLTMREDVKKNVAKSLSDAGYKKSEAENAIKEYVCYVKSRSGSGEITWDELIKRLNDLCLDDSEFGIRVQRFSKEAYWEVFFNHFDITKYDDGVAKLTFNHEYYWETENEKAYETLDKYGIGTNLKALETISQIAEKWDKLSDDDKDEIISAISASTDTHYVDKSRVDITNDQIDKITMSNADLVPEVGLRDYTIRFNSGEMICLKF